MNSILFNLIDFKKVDSLLEWFNKSTGIATAILDLEGNVLSQSAWRQICTEFHLVHPDTLKNCTINGTELANKMAMGEKYHFYQCHNGLVSVAVPIIINAEHIANLYSGQFFFEKPDEELFIKQAKKYGFDESNYLIALHKVPVVSEEKAMAAMEFLHEMTQFISEQAYQKKELSDLSKQLRENQAKFKSVFESENVGKSITLITGENYVNRAFCDMLGYTPEELQDKKWQDLTPEDEIPAIQALTEHLIKGEKDSARFEKRYISKNGSHIWADVSVTIQRNENGSPLYFITTVIDITERKQAEESKRISEDRFRVAQEMSPDGFTILHPVRNEKGEVSDFTWVYQNQAVARINGTDPKNVIGKQLLDLFPSHRGTKVFEAYLNVANTRETCILEEVYAGDILSKPTWLRMVIVSMGEEIAILVNDISERRQLELERQKFFLLAESSSDFIGMCDLDMHPFYVNPAGRRMVGLPSIEAACSVRVLDYYFPEDQKFIAEEFFPRVLQDGHGDVEIRLRNFQTGEAIWMYYYLYRVCDASGRAIGWATVSRDISERRQAENKINESEKRYRSLFENMNAGFVLFEVVQNEQGNPVDLLIVAANEGFEKTTGLNLKSAVGKHLTKVLPGIEKDEADWIGRYSQVALSGKSTHFEQGSKLLGHFYSVSAFQAAPKQCAVTFLDITERKNAELRIRESEERLRLATEQSKVAVWEYDFKTNSMSRSDNHDKLYGLERQSKWDINTFLNATHPDDRELSNSIIQNSVAPGGPDNYTFDFRAVYPDGSIHWLLVNGRVIERDETGQGITVRGTLIEITGLKRVEEEIKQLNAELEFKVEQRTAQLEATNKELEAFSYSVSHDLRAPLRHINGYVDMLNKKYHETLDDKAQHYLDTIKGASRKMGALIDDLLQFSRTGRKELSIAELNMNELLKEVMKDLSSVAEGRTVVWDIQHLPKVIGDYSLLKLVWTNLLDNALKYTRKQPSAKISVGFKAEGKEIVFCVCDNGVGFDMKYANKLFGVFQRLHSSSEFEGTGIGLANVQRIISKHNGRVWAEAEPGKGAKFYFSLPK